jgi:hypothetical protein
LFLPAKLGASNGSCSSRCIVPQLICLIILKEIKTSLLFWILLFKLNIFHLFLIVPFNVYPGSNNCYQYIMTLFL